MSGQAYAEMPTELAQANLQDITAQPLLNYLVALSYMRGTVQISETSNLNEIYADLLGAVYERGWASDQHPELQPEQSTSVVGLIFSIRLYRA